MNKKVTPNYKLIFLDILEEKFPHKKECYMSLLNKKELSQFDIIYLNLEIFKNTDQNRNRLNQKHKAYNKNSILKILDYQKKNSLNITQTALHFKMSRNTLTKWKKHFLMI